MMIFRNNHSSVSVAKNRLENLLTSDRITCQSELIPYLKDDLYVVLSKYIDVKRENFEVKLTHSEMIIRY